MKFDWRWFLTPLAREWLTVVGSLTVGVPIVHRICLANSYHYDKRRYESKLPIRFRTY